MKLSAVVTEYAEIWDDRGGFVDLPQEDWMRIPLRADWESKITGKPKVHPVFSVAMLEPMPGSDLYERPVPDQPDSIHVEGDTATQKLWEVENIVGKEGDRYLVRWKGWGPEHD